MKILTVNTWEFHGGAARAAHRLHLGMRACSVDSHMFVQNKESSSPFVLRSASPYSKFFNNICPLLDHFPTHFYPKFNAAHWTSGWVPNYAFDRTVVTQNAHLVHLHWICGGFAPVSSLKKLQVPIVWTFHDMWAFTGGCHYTGECLRYEKECGECPQLGSHRPNDLSRWTWNHKKRAWGDLDLTIITPSQWLADCARRSPLLEKYRIVTIPNGIDTSLFRPKERQQCRSLFGLPHGKKLVLFGSVMGTGDERKGFSLLQSALDGLAESSSNDDLELVVFGDSEAGAVESLSLPCHDVGVIKDDELLAALYSAVDVAVISSLEDNLPNIVMEAIACGTPCVAFEVGGIPDMIDHKVNGYLAKPSDAGDLKRGLEWVLDDQSRWEWLSTNARQKAHADFAIDKIVAQHIDLYDELLAEH